MSGFARRRLSRVGRPVADGLRNGAGRLAGVGVLPTSGRAVLGHYAAGGSLDLAALRLQPRVEDRIEEMVREAFDDVDRTVAAEFGVAPGEVGFDYGTKLLMPAELALARHYRSITARASDGFDPVAREVSPGPFGLPVGNHGPGRIDPEFSELVREVQRVERATELVVVALLDGDMRDAINDDEFGDFETAMTTDDGDRRQVAELAQEQLESAVETRLGRYPDGVREAYESAVEDSEAHQDRDEEFRRIYEDARDGDAEARSRIREEYRDADFEAPPDYAPADLDLPYFRTQYGRVGVIYEGMARMYDEAALELDDAFRRAVVLATIGAQVWLDDVDDFQADRREGQLTPVTAEYVLADSDREARRRVLDVTDQYLDRAREYADRSGSTLAGIAVEYIRYSGDPGVLPE